MAATAVVRPLVALAATWVIGPWVLVFIVVFVLAMMLIEALAEMDERHPAPETPRTTP